jgi:hypothetical protein
MRNFNKVDLVVFVLFLLFAIPGGIFTALSGVNDSDSDSNDSNDFKFSDTYFWIGVVLSTIAGIFMIVFLVRTGINLSQPTITNTNIRGVQQISPGVDLF